MTAPAASLTRQRPGQSLPEEGSGRCTAPLMHGQPGHHPGEGREATPAPSAAPVRTAVRALAAAGTAAARGTGPATSEEQARQPRRTGVRSYLQPHQPGGAGVRTCSQGVSERSERQGPWRRRSRRKNRPNNRRATGATATRNRCNVFSAASHQPDSLCPPPRGRIHGRGVQ